MRLVIPKETYPGETRVPLTPPAAAKLVKLGAAVSVERGVGEAIGFADEAFVEVGATLLAHPGEALTEADVVLRLRPPSLSEVASFKPGAVLVSLLDPFGNPELVRALAEAQVSTLCLELVPRSTLAQKMDVLSSQASLAGYAAVVVAAERLDKVLPMMTTPAGTIAPARVFVVGVGVAGLQAIATAKRLGARVEAFDTRPAVEEQVASLGARFVKIDLGETGEAQQGYAQALSDEQLAKQREAMARICAQSDVVITTAQVFGKRAPRLVTATMVAGMRPGSVLVDLAASTGGNVEGTVADEEVLVGGVRLVGLVNLPGKVARDASQMFASNLTHLVEHVWDKDKQAVVLKLEDDITAGALLTHQGEVRNPAIRGLLEGN